MKRLPLLAPPILGLLVAFAHADPKLASEPRTVPAFQGIDLAGVLDVEVTVGKPASVQVSGEADLLDKVVTTVKDGVLVLDTKRDLPRRSHLRATVTAPDLASLALSGTGSFKVTGIANDRLAISLGGTGGITLVGATGSLRVTLDGTGDLRAKDLAARDATIEVGGTGNASLSASQSLEARLTGTGNIDVHGHPQRIKKSVSGVGNIHIR